MGIKDLPILCNCGKKNSNLKRYRLSNKKGDGFLNKKKNNNKTLPISKKRQTKHEEEESHLTDYQPIPNLNPVINYMVNLGCLSPNQYFTDIVPVNIKWPNNQIPRNYATGASGPSYSGVTGDILGPQINVPDGGQPGSNGIGRNSLSTSFQSTVYLTTNTDMYNISAVANGYSSITLSGEGLLWTLWPLAKNKGNVNINGLETYFDQFTFGTRLKSRYPIGQMGFFFNNQQLGCTPFGTINLRDNEGLHSPLPNVPFNTGDPIPKESEEFDPIVGQPSLSLEEPGYKPGVQAFDETLLVDYKQHASIFVIKVSEEIARIFNPTAGISSAERYIYVGYDAWSIFRITSNPVGPMAAQTYLSPQTVTGSVTRENLQIVIPPNFPQTIYYKNIHYFGHSQGID